MGTVLYVVFVPELNFQSNNVLPTLLKKIRGKKLLIMQAFPRKRVGYELEFKKI